MIASRLFFHPILHSHMDATVAVTTGTIVMVIARNIMLMSMLCGLHFMTVMMPALHAAPVGMSKVVEGKKACGEVDREMVISSPSQQQQQGLQLQQLTTAGA